MNVQELKVWQTSRKMTKIIYLVSKKFPMSEQFGLTSQIRRASVSVISNISEGHDRGSSKEFIHFLRIARGSVAEIQAQLIVAFDIGYLKKDEYEKINNMSIEVHKMINGLIKSLSKNLFLNSYCLLLLASIFIFWLPSTILLQREDYCGIMFVRNI